MGSKTVIGMIGSEWVYERGVAGKGSLCVCVLLPLVCLRHGLLKFGTSTFGRLLLIYLSISMNRTYCDFRNACAASLSEFVQSGRKVFGKACYNTKSTAAKGAGLTRHSVEHSVME